MCHCTTNEHLDSSKYFFITSNDARMNFLDIPSLALVVDSKNYNSYIIRYHILFFNRYCQNVPPKKDVLFIILPVALESTCLHISSLIKGFLSL